jgi:Skp family chaperone for outer membrane proteins
MKRVCLVLAFAVGVVAARALGEGEERKPKPLLVGTVDVGVLFKKYERRDDLEKEINAERQKIESKFNELRSHVDEATKVLQGTAATAPDYLEKKYAQRKLVDELNAFKDESDERLKTDVEKMTLATLDDIEEEFAGFGKKNGFDLILKADSAGWGDARFQEKIFRAQVGGVLQKDPTLDVTDAMAADLNASYKKNRKR